MQESDFTISTTAGDEVLISLLGPEQDIDGLISFRNSISNETQHNFAPHN